MIVLRTESLVLWRGIEKKWKVSLGMGVRGATTMLDETDGLEPVYMHQWQGTAYRWYAIRQFSVCKIRAISWAVPILRLHDQRERII